MHVSEYCIVAALALLTGVPAAAQTRPAAPVPGEASFTVFMKGADAGRVQVNLTRAGADWQITSTGRVGDLTVNRFDLTYTADWQPIQLQIEALQGTSRLKLATSFGVTTAINEITKDGTTNSKTDQISARTVVLPNNFFAAYEALAARLSGLTSGAELPIYVAPNAEVKLTVNSVANEPVQTASGTIETRRYAVTFHNIGAEVAATVVIDARSRLARMEIPIAGVAVVRADLSGIGVRTALLRNPTDADVTIPAPGFNLAGTLTTPAAMGRKRHPAVVLVAGSGAVDRDETVAGIPIFAQLAGALAERGLIVLRYDKRGVGQSGGRTETVTLQDYAEDLDTVVKWLARRDDVDRRAVAVVGHSEGAAVAMLAAQDEDKISSLVLVAAPGITGAELVLEQQRHLLDQLQLPPEERAAKIDLQKQIQTAVMTGVGWQVVPPEIRKQVDTPWFRSFLSFDPAPVMRKIEQPILILQGDLDRQVAAANADKLAELARARKKKSTVRIEHLAGLNHLLVRAETGEVSEYSTLKEKKIAPDIAKLIAEWVRK